MADVLQTEAAALVRALAALPEQDAARPTRCAPLTVAELLGHVRVTLRVLGPMLDAPAPGGPGAATHLVGPVEYYRPDARFAPDTDARRLAAAAAAAADHPVPAAQVAALDAEVRTLLRAVRAAGAGRLVVTRHGDVMRLPDFLVTRVVEVAVHGLDLADALRVPRWTTPAAAALLRSLHVDGPRPHGAADDVAFLARVTGRDPLAPHERVAWADAGVRFLTLGG